MEYRLLAVFLFIFKVMLSFFKKEKVSENNSVMTVENDNSFESKAKMIKAHLYEKGSITSLEAIDLYNATRLSAVIFNLKKGGLDISTTPETYGKSRFVRYHLNKAI